MFSTRDKMFSRRLMLHDLKKKLSNFGIIPQLDQSLLQIMEVSLDLEKLDRDLDTWLWENKKLTNPELENMSLEDKCILVFGSEINQDIKGLI